MKSFLALIVILAGIMFSSCQHDKKQLSFYDNEGMEEDTTEVADSTHDNNGQMAYNSDEEVAVPFEEQGGREINRCDCKRAVHSENDTR